MTTKKPTPADSLLSALVEHIRLRDDASREARARAVLASLDSVIDGNVQEAQASSASSTVGKDPGEKAVGLFGLFWDSEGDDGAFGTCDGVDLEAPDEIYHRHEGSYWRHFLPLPGGDPRKP